MNILGIASSMRKESTSTRALKLTLDIVKTKYDADPSFRFKTNDTTIFVL
jgi:hypothetical protein